MVDFQGEIESRLQRINENEERIAGVLKQLWDSENLKDPESLREHELELRQKNVILRREIAEIRTKLPK